MTQSQKVNGDLIALSGHAPVTFGHVHARGFGLVVNADDWGLNRETTDRTFDCIRCGSVSAVSAMVFMEDSERASEISKSTAVDTGLHLNFTAHFGGAVPTKLAEHQTRLADYLRGNRFSQAVFNPFLAGSFEYSTKAQIEEFARLHGHEPARLDGHHHMHLCANVLLSKLLPPGTTVRKSFSFQPGEKSFVNLWYRNAIDKLLRKRHRVSDFFFTIQPLADLIRLRRNIELSLRFKVEIETHPQDPEEHSFLTSETFQRLLLDLVSMPGEVSTSTKTQA